MISHKHKCIFIHIPKAAGTSIESFFLNDLGIHFEDKQALLLGKSTNKYQEPRVISHLTARQTLYQHYISEELFNNYYKFSIVRNPIDRLYSTYNYWGFKSIITFDTFIQKQLPKLFHTDKYGFFLKSQTAYLYNENRDKNLMDFTGKLENLKDDFPKILDILDMENRPLKHVNIAKNPNIFRGVKKLLEFPPLFSSISLRSKEKILSIKSLDVVHEYYHDDLENFDYKL